MNRAVLSKIPKEVLKKSIIKEMPEMDLIDIKEINYLLFFKLKKIKKKTYDILVCSASSGDTLCSISWHGAWRQYCMKSTKSDVNQIIFNKGCLEDIINYINELMLERKSEVK